VHALGVGACVEAHLLIRDPPGGDGRVKGVTARSRRFVRDFFQVVEIDRGEALQVSLVVSPGSRSSSVRADSPNQQRASVHTPTHTVKVVA
jgi:hypothetical protein